MNRIGNQRPRLCSLPAEIDNTAAGDEVIDFAKHYGLVLDEWQQWVVHQICAERSDGSWSATQAVLLVPRQCGKSAIIEAIEMAALFLWDEQHVIYSAHLGKTAGDHMRRIRRHIEGHKDFRKQARVLTGKGDERVELWSGAILEFITRGKKTARGGSPSRVFFDEAMFLTDDQIQAMLPALAAQSMNDDLQAQMIYASSAPIAESQVLHRLRNRGINERPPRMFMAEWSAPEDCDHADRENWYIANPGLGIRISEEWIADNEFGTMSSKAFGIERLGIPEAEPVGSSVIPMDDWLECHKPHDRGDDIAYAIEVDKDGTAAAIAASDGTLGLVVEWHRGSLWLPEKLRQVLDDKPGPVFLDPKGPAGSLLSELTKHGIEWREVKPAQHAQACGEFLAAVTETHSFRHSDQQVLNIALSQASRRTYGDGWVWDRRNDDGSVSPLVAVTIARWAALQAEPVAAVAAVRSLNDFLEDEEW